MATSSLGHGEVKSIEDALECSPSAKQGSSKLYNPGEEPHAAKHSAKHAASPGGTMTGTGSNFSEKGKSKRRNMAVKP